MATDPSFASTPNCNSVAVSGTAETGRGTAGLTAVTVWTAGASGGKVEELRIRGTSTTVAGVIGIFRKVSTSFYLLDEFIIPAITPSATVGVYSVDKVYDNWVFKTGDSLVATSTVSSQNAVVTALGNDF